LKPWTILDDPDLAPVLAALPQARLVGGVVRDALAGRPVADVDLATPDPPAETLRKLQAAGLRVVPTGLAHGTVTAVSNHRPFEVTTLRRDVRTDGRHAEVAWTEDWRQDAARRDFTINAMSLDRDGVLHDYFNGAADLREGRVRFVGDAATRIAEDYLRVLRFFRFFARYASGAPDAAAIAAIAGAIPGLAILSAERVWSELKRILAAPDPVAAVALMDQLGVLSSVLPEGADPAALAALVARGAPADPLLRLAALLTGDPAAVAHRLKLSTAETVRLAALRAAPAPAPGPPALRRALAEDEPDIVMGRLWLAGMPAADRAGALSAMAEMARPVFPLEGRDALALGARPGASVGTALRQVRAWWMEGGCVADASACRARLAAVLRDEESAGWGVPPPPDPPSFPKT
jgi:poly(A) polymerase/tRNA nucleotidyltransferase (CCA-adding enzyme)